MSNTRDVKEVKVGLKRLTVLADYMEKHVKKGRFDLRSFVEHDTKDGQQALETKKDAKKAIIKIKEGFCNTSACAVGHAATIPKFNKLGLDIKPTPDGCDQFDLNVVYKQPGGHTFEGFDAAEEFFCLTWDETRQLFDPYNYGNDVSKRRVISRIRSQIKTMENRVKK